MLPILPSREALQKLSLRAIVAYAFRIADRLSPELRGILPDSVIDSALHTIESVATAPDLRGLNPADIIREAEHIVAACKPVAEHLMMSKKFRFVFSITQATTAAMCVCHFAHDSTNAQLSMNRTLDAAERTAQAIMDLNSAEVAMAISEARRDYEMLLSECGEQSEPTIGDIIHCFDTPSGS